MFCKTVWNGLYILPDGYIRLCSIGVNSKPELDLQRCRDRDGNVMHILTHDIKDIMNSDKHREVRRLNVSDPDKWSPHCDCCEVREIATNFDRTHVNKSRRIYLMKVESDDIVNEHNYSEKMDADGSIDWMPSSLDIRFGNLCNQKCIMCGPSFSNMWYDEFFEYYNKNSFGQGTQVISIKDETTGKWSQPAALQWYEDPRWWPKFESMMPFLKHIYITGGEPMVTPAHDTMLDKLIDSGFSKDIILEYDTNCSAINDKIVARWKHFKRVEIRGSMDSTGEQYETIRFPGKWEKFKSNVLKLKQYSIESNGKINLQSLSTCFQITTAHSIITTEEWCKSIGVPMHLRFLEGPPFHSVASLPDKIKLELIEYYKAYQTSSKKADMIIKYLETHMGQEYDPSVTAEFIKFMDYLDTTRGTQWKSIFPLAHGMMIRAMQ